MFALRSLQIPSLTPEDRTMFHKMLCLLIDLFNDATIKAPRLDKVGLVGACKGWTEKDERESFLISYFVRSLINWSVILLFVQYVSYMLL
jgi:hypothetical protein